ncbi:hypothetical protein LCGC14_1896880 [marine sediment metagenome]|uniref:Uncharacterized protein n=1 Tax=marine sediment metagenome TaxID=412755 RepID=A0A0F9GL38_9ZZZZ
MSPKVEDFRKLVTCWRSYMEHLRNSKHSTPSELAVLSTMEATYGRCAGDIERLLEGGPDE